MGNLYDHNWTVARVDRLKALVEDGLSSSEIGTAMGISRSAVIGKVSRMGFQLSRASGGRGHTPRPRKPHAPRVERLGLNGLIVHHAAHQRAAVEAQPVAESVAVEPTDIPPDTSPCAVTLLELTEDTCRWSLGEPSADMRYCGAHVVVAPYCNRHAAIAYRPIEIRRRAA